MSYPFLGKYLDQLNCSLNSVFVAGNSRREGQLQLNVFGPLLLSSLVISVYESFRPVHRRSNFIVGLLAQSASFFYLLGQRFTAGFSTPLHYVFLVWSAASGAAAVRGNPNGLVPSAEHVWSTLIACTAGYLVPTVYAIVFKMNYQSLSIWQPFPLYVLALNLVLPPIIRSVLLPALPFSRTQSRKVGTFLIALLCTAVSSMTHWELIASTLLAEHGVDIRDVLLLRAQPEAVASTFAHAAHALFTIDFASVLLTNMIVAIPAFGGNIPRVISTLIPFILITVAAGPGAAVIITWATAEMSLQSQVADAAFKVKTK